MSPKQEKFCIEYARTGNATQAAEMAGYSKRSAGRIGGENLKKVEIQKRLQELSAEVKNAKIADVTRCLELLSEIAEDKKQKGITRVQALDKLLMAQGAYSMQLNLNSVTPVILRDDVNE